VWHRVVFHVVWGADYDTGRVSLWFDGEKVVDSVSARTYLGNPAFIQLGILRDTIVTPETLFIDEALEGSSFEDVALLDRFPLVAPAPMPSSTATTPAPTLSTPPTTAEPAPSQSGCAFAPSERMTVPFWLSLLGGTLLGRLARRMSTSRSIRPEPS
jgi:hypothetical protein